MSILEVGAGSVVVSGHRIDFTDRVTLGRNVIVGGRNVRAEQIRVRYDIRMMASKTRNARHSGRSHGPGRRPVVHRSRVSAPQRAILSKIRALPPDKVPEVEDFIEFLRQRQEDSLLTRAATRMAEKAFEAVWSNPEDAAYDRL